MYYRKIVRQVGYLPESHILCSLNFFFENYNFCEIICKNTVQPDRQLRANKHGAYALHAR